MALSLRKSSSSSGSMTDEDIMAAAKRVDGASSGLDADLLDGNHAAAFAAAAAGVTNGDSHDHAGGDGAQVDHGGLTGLADDDHAQYVTTISADLALYVATTGSDTTGTGAVGAPWATAHKAFAYLQRYVIAPGKVVTINIAAGTYSHAGNSLIMDHPQGGQIRITGAGVATTKLAFTGYGGLHVRTSLWHLSGFTLESTSCLFAALLIIAGATILTTTSVNPITITSDGASAVVSFGMADLRYITVTVTGAGRICVLVQNGGYAYLNSSTLNCSDGAGSYHLYATGNAVINTASVTYQAPSSVAKIPSSNPGTDGSYIL